MKIEDRLYQEEAFKTLYRESRAGHFRRVLLCAPTGSGKTVIASLIIRKARAKGSRIIFMAHRKELVVQAHNKLVDVGIPPGELGVMMASHPLTNPKAPTQVASVQTLPHRVLPAADLLIVDEAHRSVAPTYQNIIHHYANSGAFVIGMTATPFRADNRGLGDLYQHLVMAALPSRLISEGYLVEPRIFTVPEALRLDLSSLPLQSDGDYDKDALEDLMNRPGLVGRIVEHYLKYGSGMRAVVFAAGVKHSRAICESFLRAGIKAEHLDGKTPDKERDAILARLASGETQIVCNCQVLTEGWDQPPVKVCILARPTKSAVMYLQMVGRILRPWGGLIPVILDHAGLIPHFKMCPQDDQEYTLDPDKEQKPSRSMIKTCPACGAVCHLLKVRCPECGYLFDPKAEIERDALTESNDRLVEYHPISDEECQHVAMELRTNWLRRALHASENGKRAPRHGSIFHSFQRRLGRRPFPNEGGFIDDADANTKRLALDILYKEAEATGHEPSIARFWFKGLFGHWPQGGGRNQ